MAACWYGIARTAVIDRAAACPYSRTCDGLPTHTFLKENPYERYPENIVA